jgi:hypothetical protein
MSSIQRRFALLIGAALVVAAFAAPSAMAMEVRDAEGSLCSAVSPAINKADPFSALMYGSAYQSGGCTVHMESVGGDAGKTKVSLPNGRTNICTVSYDIHIGPDGWGYATNFQYSDWDPIWGESCVAWQGGPSGGANSQVVAPKGVNPSGLFSGENAATDFNGIVKANRIWNGLKYTLADPISFDASVLAGEEESELFRLDNQLTSGSSKLGGGWRGGSWDGDAVLQITQ